MLDGSYTSGSLPCGNSSSSGWREGKREREKERREREGGGMGGEGCGRKG